MPSDDLDNLDSAVSMMPSPRAAAVAAVGENPDKAAEAVNLGASTGVPAPVIHQDLDGFKAKVNAQTAGYIAQNNPKIGQYLISDDMKAKVSSDDLANLDTYSQAASALPKESIFAAVGRGFREGYNLTEQAGEFNKLEQQYPLWHGTINPALALVDTVVNRLPNAGFGALTAGLQHYFGEKTGAEFSEFAQVAMMGAGAEGGVHVPEELNNFAKAAQKAQPYIEAGKEPPRGLDPVIDDIHKKESAADLDKLKEAFKAAQASATKERVPDFFHDFADQHHGEDTVGISSDVAEALYGGKVPEEGDNLLGFVPDMPQQLATAMETGADVQVPIADMMTHMTPEVFDAVQDGIRVRPEGFTKVEDETPKPVVEDQKLFEEPAAVGMTKIQDARYQGLIEQQAREIDEANQKRAQAFEAKRQTLEWKQNRNKMMNKVIDDFGEMPRFYTDRALRGGEVKIATNALTDEQKAALPGSYYAKNGKLPDNIARVMGYESGDAMIQDLSDLHKNRGEMRPERYVTQLIENETDRRMEAKYGSLKDNIVQVAKEQTLSKTNIDLMGAELEAMAAEHGLQMPFTKDDLQARAKDVIAQSRMGTVDSDAYLRAAARVSNGIENALLAGDPATAFKLRQQKWAATVYAKEAVAIEKVKDAFDRQMKTFEKREVPTTRQEYTDQIHGIMTRIGEGVKRSVQDIQENMTKGGFKDLADFVQQKTDQNRPLPVPEFLLDPAWKKNVKDMTTDEFKQVAGMVKALAKNGRDELQGNLKGEKFDLAELKSRMNDQLKALTDNPREYTGHTPEVDKTTWQKVKSFGWSAVNIETICKRLDGGDPDGLFTQLIARPAIRAMNYRDRMVKETAEKLNKIGDFEDLHKDVDNDIFRRPDIENGGFIKMSRNNVIAVLGHMGNADNFARLTQGWGVNPEMVKVWVAKNTTKADWDKMQKIGEIFDELFKKADSMSYELNEIGIQKLELGVVDDPHGGGYKGWYNPVAYDQHAVRAPKVGEEPVPLEVTPTGVNGLERYFATTNQGYTKARTGFRAPVLLDTSSIPTRMQQMIHDIAMRPTILELNKYVNDRQLMANVRNYYNPTAADMFKPWVKDLAGASDADPATLGKVNDLFGAFLRNTAAAEIGFNIGTVLKHGATALTNSIMQVGPDFAHAMFIAGTESPVRGKTWAEFAMDKSDELARRSRLTPEALAVQTGLKFPGAEATAAGKAKALGAALRNYGTMGVSMSDLASAVPSWIAEYRKQLAGGATEGDAIDRADQAVREAHGSSALTNKPEIMRSKNAFAQAMTQFYGFFNEMLQKVFEMGWRGKEAFGSAWDGNFDSAAKNGARAANIMTRVVMAGLIEEAVSGQGDPKEGWLAKTLKGMLHAFGSTLPVVRDLVQAITSNRDPQGSLFAAGIKSVSDISRDLESKKAGNRVWAQRFGRDLAMMASTVSGVPLKHPVSAGQFLYNYYEHREHPTSPLNFAQGLARGTAQRRP